MKTIRSPLLRPRYLWALAVACGGAGLIYGRFDTREDLATTPAGRPPMASTKELRPAVLSPPESVKAWSEVAETVVPAGHPAITITGRHSIAREKAFQSLLAGMRHDNAADLHEMLRSERAMPTDREWQAFMEKWGRLDGPGAASHIEGSAEAGAWIPGLLRGWASVDPAAADAWLDACLAATNEREEWHAPAQRELVLGWLRADSGGAANWLNEHRGSAAYPEIAAAFAQEVVRIDPMNALEWAGSVEGPWRKWAMETVGREWLKKDAPAASAALGLAGYGEEEIQRLTTDPAEGFDLLDTGIAPGEELPGISFADQ